jgi:hypothetical protein
MSISWVDFTENCAMRKGAHIQRSGVGERGRWMLRIVQQNGSKKGCELN